ncbi:MAG: hypothetical protein AAF899_16020 [Pseudomonadota bacterium]
MLGAALLIVLMDKPMRGPGLSQSAPASYAQMVEENAVGTAISISGISTIILIGTTVGIAYAVAWYWRRRSTLLRDEPRYLRHAR